MNDPADAVLANLQKALDPAADRYSRIEAARAVIGAMQALIVSLGGAG